jgi:CelD/BcsL family acetyltransferase involved in cellulose biosynthesis
MSTVILYPLKFQAGARTLLAVHRPLMRIAFSLRMAMDAEAPVLPPLGRAAGYVVTSIPEILVNALRAEGLIAHIRQSYRRYFADFGAGFDAYMAHFSGKARATLKRKLKRYADLSGGMIDVRCYRTPEDMAAFVEAAALVSRKSYQHRLLDAGLPDDDAARAEMAALAAADRVRAFLLFRSGRPTAYLYMPVTDEILIYAYLGYDPDDGENSPGTVLQIEAIRLLAEEGRYSRLDFTEGEGQHKRLFSTGSIACADVLLLRPTIGNRLLIAALKGFDATIANLKQLSNAQGFAWLKALRR